MEETFADVLKDEFRKRNNPTDLKSAIIGKIVKLSPLTVQLEEGNILLEEGTELEISEWFRLRCNINAALLDSGVSSSVDNALKVQEIHSFGGVPCLMPNAISYLAEAILSIRNEFLKLKCELSVGDFVVVSTLEELNKYILIDKVLTEDNE